MLGIWPHLCCSSFVAGTMSKKTRAMSIISSVKELKEWGIGSKANYFEFLHMKIMISPDDCSVGRRWISAMAIIQRCGSSGSMCVCVHNSIAPISFLPAHKILSLTVKMARLEIVSTNWKKSNNCSGAGPTLARGGEVQMAVLHLDQQNDPISPDEYRRSFWSGHFTQHEQMMFHCRALNDSAQLSLSWVFSANREATSLSDPPKLNEQNSLLLLVFARWWWWKSILLLAATYGAFVSN